MNENYIGPGEAQQPGSINTSAGLQDLPPSLTGKPAPPPGSDTEQEKMFDFSTAYVHLKRIIDDWNTEVEDTEVRRKTRKVELDVEGLRQKGDLDEDETIVPVRTIDVNIQRELPAYVNYLKNSRRICTFFCLSDPGRDPQHIESDYARGMTYTAWEKPHFKEIDGSATHGWAAVEVVFDSSKPLNCSLEYVAHDKLYWGRTVENFQDAPRIIRAYDVTVTKLREWTKTFGFDPTQVENLLRPRKDTQKENETARIYKVYLKKEGVVYVAWFATTDLVTDWLKAPTQHYVGIKHKVQVPTQVPQPDMPVQTPQGIAMIPQPPQTIMQEQWQESPLMQYPIFILPYRESEEPKEVDKKGRCFYDEPKQESQTAILSGYINGLTRASNIYASPAQEDGTGAALKEIEDVILRGGRFMSKPVNFWNPPYPPPETIKALEYMDANNSEETNQVNFATLNREDSRKTAREISAAQQQQQILNSVQLTLYSTHIREVYSFAWLIVQSQALQGEIRFMLIPNPQFNQQMPEGPQNLKLINDEDTISQTWELRAAGDVDVVQRAEKIQQMKQDWPVIANTPLAMRFLADLLKLEYPDTGEQYADIVMQADAMQQMKGLLGGLAHIMTAMIQENPQMIRKEPPQNQQQLAQMLQQAAQLSGVPAPNSNGKPPQQQSPQQQQPQVAANPS